ncbi:ABC transporter ATP-binding protein [Knoellia subterranea]|uniref:Multidrug ABC transporter ATPase n=1 Tax=Knoellia subterranea KCTC 19937 TaxID=1385521 RepID=A0A0A0JKX5_9MICO|nr:ABC transporter ATP-binding protein [Knoellia subterranea]KGN38050.1 multidrug ABC transporter ATPase [Knoellia subterranea KCTC 19937]
MSSADGAVANGGGIVVERVHRAFGDVVAVDDISLVARPGEVTALIGPNGAGKTTLMLMLATLLVPDDGSITIDGYSPVDDPREVRRRIGWMPDGFGTWDALTVREVLHTIGAMYDLGAAESRIRTDEVLEQVHLADLADRRARVLSRGQKQRLGMARALLHRPTTLILDEPASGLDPRSRIELRDLLRGLAASGTTVLVSSHILTELQEMADRAVIVSRGRSIESQAVDGATPVARTWRVAALDRGRLVAALREVGANWNDAGTAVDVLLEGDPQAAELLARLVESGAGITAYAPLHGEMEAAYLAATEDRQ